MKRLVIISAIAAIIAAPAFGAAAVKPAAAKAAPVKTAAQPALTVPAYPGSTQVMEMALSEKDMLNWFTNVLPAMAAMSAGSSEGILGMISKLDLAGLANALQGLKQIKVVQFDLPKRADNSVQKVTDFYTAQMEKEGNWTRVFWKSDNPQSAVTVYSRPDAQEIFITQAKVTPTGGKLMVGRTLGRVDLAKVIEWAAKNAHVFEAAREAKK